MNDLKFEVHADARQAATPPGWVYTNPAVYERARERVFARSWQFAADTECVKIPGQVHPYTLLEGCLDEPLLLTRDTGDQLHNVSNVCTHRGALVCEHGGAERFLRCRYHGRRFGLDGKFQHMPEFEQTANFPTEADHLRGAPFHVWRKFIFTALQPPCAFEEWIGPMRERVGWLPLEEFTFEPARSRDYLVRANWALYCDNYLEGFHVPFVHPALGEMLDFGGYRTELFRYSNVQIGVAKGGEHVFDLPQSSPDHGRRVAAYYFWLFPNTMFNFYPWGLSINIVKPLAVDRTRVSFLSYVWDRGKIDSGAGAALDRVEREDESVVESVHKGLHSRAYTRGRYSPTYEQGVHHFHRLLAESLG